MIKRLTVLAIVLLASDSYTAHAQSIMLTKMSKTYPNTPKDESPVCFSTEELISISDKMFTEGNPKYIWVDLIKDGLVAPGDQIGYHVYLYIDKKENGGNIPIPAELQQVYLAKWTRFMQQIKEPVNSTATYQAHLNRGILCKDISNETSAFRKISKGELNDMDLNTRGELALLETLFNDGLADPSKPLQLDFSTKGYYVNGQRMSVQMHDKYREICLAEFGTDYSSLGSYMKRGPLEAHTLAKDIAELKGKITVTELQSAANTK